VAINPLGIKELFIVKIILLGYMGSGKSTVAKALATLASLQHRDLDREIEADAGRSIREIFQTEGEIKFRKREHETLVRILSEKGPFVLSLGGGTPCYANNHELLSGPGIVSVYLKSTPQTLAGRLQNEAAMRPLLQRKSGDEILSFIAPHLFERSYFYMKADQIVSTDGKSPGEIAAEILSLLA
jgi:shikimate kinase